MLYVLALAQTQGVDEFLSFLKAEPFRVAKGLALQTNQSAHNDLFHFVRSFLLHLTFLPEALQLNPLAQASIFVLAVRAFQPLYLPQQQLVLLFEVEVLVLEDAFDRLVVVMDTLTDVRAVGLVVVGSGLRDDRAW